MSNMPGRGESGMAAPKRAVLIVAGFHKSKTGSIGAIIQITAIR
jgi:hypothetical protein